MVNVKMDKKELARQLRDNVAKYHTDLQVNHWYYTESDTIGLTLSNEKEYITISFDDTDDVALADITKAAMFKLLLRKYDKHITYHKNLKQLNEIVERYSLSGYISHYDMLYVLPTGEYEDAPYEFDISTDGVIDICESDNNFSVVLDEGVMVIDKLSRTIRVTLDN